jgi:hypothetical protein
MPVTANVGDELESQCGRCHDATKHKVLTLDDKGRAKRCECLVCGGKHLWRKPRGPQPRKGKTPEEKAAEAAAKKAEEDASAYAMALAGASDGEPVGYSIRDSYEEGQKVAHKKFGEGVVTKITPPGTMEVCFLGGTRSLVMNR